MLRYCLPKKKTTKTIAGLLVLAASCWVLPVDSHARDVTATRTPSFAASSSDVTNTNGVYSGVITKQTMYTAPSQKTAPQTASTQQASYQASADPAIFVEPPTRKMTNPTNGIYIAPKFLSGLQVPAGMDEKYSALGYTYSEKNNDTTTEWVFGGGLAAGYDFYPHHKVPIRLELEYLYRSDAKYNTTYDWGLVSQDFRAKVGIQTLFANTYLDFHNSTRFTPYIGGGIGVAFVNAKLTDSGEALGYKIEGSGSKRSTNFAWNVGAGTAFALTDKLSLDFNYRFVGFGEAKATASTTDQYLGKVSSTYKSDLYGHEFLLGLRYTF